MLLPLFFRDDILIAKAGDTFILPVVFHSSPSVARVFVSILRTGSMQRHHSPTKKILLRGSFLI